VLCSSFGTPHGVGGAGVQDEADGLAVGVALGQGDDAGAVGFGPGLLGEGEAFPGPVVEPGEHDVGLVDLVAGAAEVLADRAEIGAAADAVIQERGGLGPVGVGAGAGAHAQLHLQRRADHAGLGEAGKTLGVHSTAPGATS
jgi:hypothetical protein